MDGSTKILSLSYCWWWIVKGPILCPLMEHVPACATASFLVQTCQYSVEIRHLEVSQILVLLLADCYWWLHCFCKPTKNPWSVYIYIYISIYKYICGDKTTELLCPPPWVWQKLQRSWLTTCGRRRRSSRRASAFIGTETILHLVSFLVPIEQTVWTSLWKRTNFIIYSYGNDQLWDQLNFVFFWAGICYKST